MRYSGKSGDRFASKPIGELETTSDQFEYLSSRSGQLERDMHDGFCRKRSERGEREQLPVCLLDLAEFLPALSSSSIACKVEKLI